MASLVAVNDCRVVQRTAMFFREGIDRLQNEFYMQAFAKLVRQRLVRTSVKDGREAASAVLVEQAGYIRQQILSSPTGFELPVDEVGRTS